ncbi:hypothetical protein DFJ77DRAFT_520245 [Powellomyces hirtus]|nr:hypothetical protein DFJ77DRAFT_520245 [Powellomyces hirtus]
MQKVLDLEPLTQFPAPTGKPATFRESPEILRLGTAKPRPLIPRYFEPSPKYRRRQGCRAPGIHPRELPLRLESAGTRARASPLTEARFIASTSPEAVNNSSNRGSLNPLGHQVARLLGPLNPLAGASLIAVPKSPFSPEGKKRVTSFSFVRMTKWRVNPGYNAKATASASHPSFEGNQECQVISSEEIIRNRNIKESPKSSAHSRSTSPKDQANHITPRGAPNFRNHPPSVSVSAKKPGSLAAASCSLRAKLLPAQLHPKLHTHDVSNRFPTEAHACRYQIVNTHPGQYHHIVWRNPRHQSSLRHILANEKKCGHCLCASRQQRHRAWMDVHAPWATLGSGLPTSPRMAIDGEAYLASLQPRDECSAASARRATPISQSAKYLGKKCRSHCVSRVRAKVRGVKRRYPWVKLFHGHSLPKRNDQRVLELVRAAVVCEKSIGDSVLGSALAKQKKKKTQTGQLQPRWTNAQRYDGKLHAFTQLRIVPITWDETGHAPKRKQPPMPSPNFVSYPSWDETGHARKRTQPNSLSYLVTLSNGAESHWAV